MTKEIPEKQLSSDYQVRQITEFKQLIKSTVATETEIENYERQRAEEIQKAYESNIADLTNESDATLSKLNSENVEKLATARHSFEINCEEAERDRNVTSDDISRHRSEAIATSKIDHETLVAQLEDAHEQSQKNAEEDHAKFHHRCRALYAKFQQTQANTEHVLSKRGLGLVESEPSKTASNVWSSTLIKNFESAREAAEGLAAQIRNRPASRYIDDGWSILLAICLVIAIGAALMFYVPAFPFLATTGLAAAISLSATMIVHWIAKRNAATAAKKSLPELQDQMSLANAAIIMAPKVANTEIKAAIRELLQRRNQNLSDAKIELEQQIDDAELQANSRRAKLEKLFAAKIQELEGNWNDEAAEIRAFYGPKIESKKVEFSKRRSELDQRYHDEIEETNKTVSDRWDQLTVKWNSGLARFLNYVTNVNTFCDENFPRFSNVDWESWSPASQASLAVQTGMMLVNSKLLSPELPQNERIDNQCPEKFECPTTLAFPDTPSLILNASEQGRTKAASIIRNSMLRFATTFPPGKVRFTIIDPIGLGQNFSAFMHLTDFDETLINNRIWTESSHINQKLLDLTEHMENVIQKYLRNEFDSIHQYNEHAGEVAEVFQVLVVADFPANFTEETIRRLISIANSGPRCGVYMLLYRDTKLKLPRGFDPDDLYRSASVFNWNGSHFESDHEVLKPFDVTLESSPDEQTTTAILKAIGKHAAEASRVEVPFETVAPRPGEEWTKSSASEIEVALGRAGAIRLLTMKLGKGTSQHVLISGKTGSGKSTLLHAMITNLALHYSPDEVEFYLIDFKKGVEFKAYAEFGLPHARVIAIESEREFGMSVLRRLDQELRQRGDLFREAGVQSLKAFRKANPETPMPRIMFIVDEFQEFFVNDDRIAHDASLLLDRLVRQGRAFGMHVILGSQTLAGAYSLARSTLGQMAVRIALQCSAADAHLILSEDNTAARLLNRPGEAIYNDANGLFEGNNLFQVVWLSDEQKAFYLKRIREISAHSDHSTSNTIVFEGNAAASIEDNSLLQELLSSDPASNVVGSRAYLGAAIEIKDPTSVLFQRQHGSNLLIVGQRPELAAGILTSTILSLTATSSTKEESPCSRSIKFYFMDGQRSDLGASLSDRLSSRLPATVCSVSPKNAAEAINEIAIELKTRSENDTDCEPIFLIISDLSRFRVLQSDDDFGFSSFGEDEKPNTGKQFSSIIADGPPVGIHVVLWSDSYNNVTRWFGRKSIKEFGLRVLFQMSTVDSSNLIETAAAGQLGSNRAILYRDDSAETEKFRPYDQPSDEYLVATCHRIANAPIVIDKHESGPPPSEASSFAT